MTEQAVGCRHPAWGDTSHCAHMECHNYINKCTDTYDHGDHLHQREVDVQALPDKIYFQYTDLDRGESDLQQNCAISYEQAADLWQQLRAAWLTRAGKEELILTAQSVEEGDFYQGWEIKAAFIDLEHVTLHFDNFGKLVVPNRTMLTIWRTIQ